MSRASAAFAHWGRDAAFLRRIREPHLPPTRRSAGRAPQEHRFAGAARRRSRAATAVVWRRSSPLTGSSSSSTSGSVTSARASSTSRRTPVGSSPAGIARNASSPRRSLTRRRGRRRYGPAARRRRAAGRAGAGFPPRPAGSPAPSWSGRRCRPGTSAPARACCGHRRAAASHPARREAPVPNPAAGCPPGCEKRGLPGSIRSDESGDPAGFRSEADVVEHGQTAVALAEVVGDERAHRPTQTHRVCSSRRPSLDSRRGASGSAAAAAGTSR